MSQPAEPTWMQELADAVRETAPPPQAVKTGVVVDAHGDSGSRVITVSYEGGDAISATWSSAFELVIATKGPSGVVGVKVKILFDDGQPFISDMIIGS